MHGSGGGWALWEKQRELTELQAVRAGIHPLDIARCPTADAGTEKSLLMWEGNEAFLVLLFWLRFCMVSGWLSCFQKQ